MGFTATAASAQQQSDVIGRRIGRIEHDRDHENESNIPRISILEFRAGPQSAGARPAFVRLSTQAGGSA